MVQQRYPKRNKYLAIKAAIDIAQYLPGRKLILSDSTSAIDKVKKENNKLQDITI